jgi:PKD repeat protein
MKKCYLLVILSLFTWMNSFSQQCFYANLSGGTVYQWDFFPPQQFMGQGYAFAWDFGDSTTSNDQLPTHAYNSAGNYYVCLTITDSATGSLALQCCDSVGTLNNNCTFSYQITPGTPAVAQFVGIPSMTTGSTLVWDFGDGTTGAGPIISHSYLQPGTYLVCMYERDSITQATYCSSCLWIPVTATSGCLFSTTPSIIDPYTFAFDCIPSTTTDPVIWDFGDNTTDSGVSVSHTYLLPGTYTITMTIYTPNGPCSYFDVVTIGSTTLCSFLTRQDSLNPMQYYFDATGSTAGSTFSWDFGDGSTGTGQNVGHLYTTNGTYTVTMSEFDSNGLILCSYWTTISIGLNTSCNFYPSPLPNSTQVDFYTQFPLGASVTWDFGDGTSATGTFVSHVYNAFGTYNVCVVAAYNGMTCSSCSTVVVSNNPVGGCSFTAIPDSINPFLLYVFASGSGNTYVWDFGDGSAPDTGAFASHVYASAGTYNVCVYERDSIGLIVCSICHPVVIGTVFQQCQANFAAVSVGLDAYFVDMSTVSSTSTMYMWDFGDGGTSTAQYPQYTYALPGWYRICLTIIDANCQSSYCDSLYVDSVISNPTACNAFFVFTQTAAYQMVAVNLSSGFNLAFNWDFGDGTTSNLPYPTHTYNVTGTYAICLTVSDNAGCVSTYCDTLSVDSLGQIHYHGLQGFVLNVLSPEAITGIDQTATEIVTGVFPNPATTTLHINTANGISGSVDYRIVNVTGAEIRKGSLNSGENIISVDAISPGLYMIEFRDSKGSRSFNRFIKE